MKIYTLSNLGYRLSHSTRNPNTPEWRVIHYLARNHQASGEKLMGELGVDASVLSKLSQKHILIEDTGVTV